MAGAAIENKTNALLELIGHQLKTFLPKIEDTNMNRQMSEELLLNNRRGRN